ncbi:hypothetical protein [Cutibacterium avidum]|uniref:hypothetical protein n=1 Tax=Cutibacterium avidum TaxID=33010 RepID=UPI00083E945B|nr:hypothetical protein [Cutibacterium avidum]AOG28897.1 hypothetical protein BFS79_10725 [Cutibacterium avidum]
MLLLALLPTGKDRGRPKKGPADEAMSTARSLSIEQLAAPRDMRIPVSRIDDTLVAAYYVIPPERRSRRSPGDAAMGGSVNFRRCRGHSPATPDITGQDS